MPSNPHRPRNLSISALSAAALVMLGCCCAPALFGAEATNSAAPLLVSPSISSTGPSLLRVLGALSLVLGLFLGGVWLFRNGRQFAFRTGKVPRLNILESRSLGGRQALYVVGYDQERFLLAATPAGINLLSHLPSASADENAVQHEPPPGVPFARALTQMLKNGGSSGGSK
ncbi:MAG TPA: FliO/MopB family protein [Clostridia bacterium]|nr:FliO/MopB family protein [Clostridia bacterium]